VDTIFDGLADPPPSRTFFDALYARFALANCWRVFDDALPAITRLKGRGLRLGVVSNWDERLEPILVNTGLRRHFEVVIVSINEGVRKPDASIFLEAARQLDSPASGVLHVGDSFEEDYQGAKRAGCQAKWLARRVTAERADGVIQSLEEIENCLD
jgi:putative hydrolase of the HAD superfamily